MVGCGWEKRRFGRRKRRFHEKQGKNWRVATAPVRDQEAGCYEMKSLIVVISHNFQDIRNELDWFHPHETVFIYLFINTVPCHPQI
jgi:hypothetical protein